MSIQAAAPAAMLRIEPPPSEAEVAEREAQQPIAEATIAKVQSWFADSLGLDGYDGAGSAATIAYDPRTDWAGTSWRPGSDSREAVAQLRVGRTPEQIDTGIPADAPLAGAQDVIAHEYAHLVLNSHLTGRSRPGSMPEADPAARGQQRAIDEGFADVFAAAIDRDWKVGPGAGQRNPSTGRGVITDLDDADRTTTSHELSGVLTNAASDIQRSLGWDDTAELFMDVVRDPRMTWSCGFSDVAALLADHAGRDHGVTARRMVLRAFRDNGVEPTRLATGGRGGAGSHMHPPPD